MSTNDMARQGAAGEVRSGSSGPGPSRRGKARLGSAGRGRICQTVEQSFQAGWQDGADDPPLTPEQRTKIAAMLAPFVRPLIEAA